MKQQPVIIIQLVHIQGPFKGKIQEFSEARITIGRHPSSLLRFPADLAGVSRNHAEIVREGNRFKLIDHSTYGTFVNGKRIKEAYLKNADVLSFAEGGPKVSFLTQIQENQSGKEGESLAPQPTELPASLPHSPYDDEPRPSSSQEPDPFSQDPFSQEPDPTQSEHGERGEIAVQSLRVPLVIQYGPTLRSFKAVPVTIGKEGDFQLDHPGIHSQHVQVFYNHDHYWVKDLTGQKLITINQQPINLQSPLNPGDELALSPRGPLFRFLGSGRLAEIQEPGSEHSISSDQKEKEGAQKDTTEKKDTKSPLSILKKLWKH